MYFHVDTITSEYLYRLTMQFFDILFWIQWQTYRIITGLKIMAGRRSIMPVQKWGIHTNYRCLLVQNVERFSNSVFFSPALFETECNQLTWSSHLRINVKRECSLLVWSHFSSHLFRKYAKIYLNSYKPYFICWPCVKIHVFLSRAVSTCSWNDIWYNSTTMYD